MELKYIIKENDNYLNINDVLLKEFKFSNRLISKLKRNHKVLKNNIITDTRENIKSGDIILVNLDEKEDNSNVVATSIPLDIIYEDEWLLVVDKPFGISIHPSILHYSNSLSNGVKFYFDKIRSSQKNKTCKSFRLKYSWFSYFCQM